MDRAESVRRLGIVVRLLRKTVARLNRPAGVAFWEAIDRQNQELEKCSGSEWPTTLVDPDEQVHKALWSLVEHHLASEEEVDGYWRSYVADRTEAARVG